MTRTAQPIFASGGSLPGGQTLPMIGSTDGSGNYATAIEQWVMSSGGLFVPSPVDALNQPIHSSEGTAPSFTASTGTIAGTNTNTSFTLTLGSLAAGNGLFDAKQATIRVLNDATSQTITGLTLTLQDTVGGTAIPITYSATVSIASGGTYTWVVPLTSGIATNASLGVAFGTAPVAGSVSTTATFQGPGAPVTSLAGSNAPLPYKEIDYSGTFANPNGTLSIPASGTYVTPGEDLRGYRHVVGVGQSTAGGGTNVTIDAQDPSGIGQYISLYQGTGTSSNTQWPAVFIIPTNPGLVMSVYNTSSTQAAIMNLLAWMCD